MKRGQAAFEFLLSYGTMFIILLAMIGLLVYLGVLDFSQLGASVCTTEPEFYCDDHKVSEDGTISVSIRNNFGGLKVVDVNLTTSDCELSNSSYHEEGVKDKTYLGGEDKLIIFTCDEPLVFDERFTAELTLSYIRQDYAITHFASGKIVTRVE